MCARSAIGYCSTAVVAREEAIGVRSDREAVEGVKADRPLVR